MNRPTASPKELFSTLARKSLDLLEVECAIFAAEMAEKRNQSMRTLVWLASSALIGLGAFGLLLVALMLGMIEWGLPPWMAALTLGTTLALIGFLTLRHALALLRGLNLKLPQSMAEMRKNARLLTRSHLHV